MSPKSHASTDSVSYRLYYSPDSANLVVRAALEEVGAAYETELVDRGKGEQRSEWFRALNPPATATLREGTRSRMLGHKALLSGEMERHGGGYLLEGGFSVCDFYLAFCCRWLMTYPQDFRTDPSGLQALLGLWRLLERIEARPSVERACRAEWIEPPFITAPRMPQPPVGSVLG